MLLPIGVPRLIAAAPDRPGDVDADKPARLSVVALRVDPRGRWLAVASAGAGAAVVRLFSWCAAAAASGWVLCGETALKGVRLAHAAAAGEVCIEWGRLEHGDRGAAPAAGGGAVARLIVWFGPGEDVHVLDVEVVTPSRPEPVPTHALPLPAWLPEAASPPAAPLRVSLRAVAVVRVVADAALAETHVVASAQAAGRSARAAVVAAGFSPERPTHGDTAHVAGPSATRIAALASYKGSLLACTRGRQLMRLPGLTGDASTGFGGGGDTVPVSSLFRGATGDGAQWVVRRAVMCEEQRLLGLTFVDGRAGVAAAASDFGRMAGLGCVITERLLGVRARGDSGGSAGSGGGSDAGEPPRVTCLAFSSVTACVAVALATGDVHVFAVQPLRHRGALRRAALRLAPRHVLSLAPWDFRYADTGEAASAAFSPSGDALAVGYSSRGVVVWGASGVRLASTLPAAGSGVARRDGEPMSRGARCLSWSPDGLQLAAATGLDPAAAAAASSSGVVGAHHVCVFEFVRAGADGAPGFAATTTGEGCPTLLGGRQALVFRNTGADPTRFHWRPQPVPPVYTGAHAPLLCCAASSAERVAVAGARGLALWCDRPIPEGKWRLFSSVSQEAALCVHGLAWWTPALLLALHRDVAPCGAADGEGTTAEDWAVRLEEEAVSGTTGGAAAHGGGAAAGGFDDAGEGAGPQGSRRRGEATATSEGYASDATDDSDSGGDGASAPPAWRRRATYTLLAFPHDHLDFGSLRLWQPLPVGLHPVALSLRAADSSAPDAGETWLAVVARADSGDAAGAPLSVPERGGADAAALCGDDDVATSFLLLYALAPPAVKPQRSGGQERSARGSAQLAAKLMLRTLGVPTAVVLLLGPPGTGVSDAAGRFDSVRMLVTDSCGDVWLVDAASREQTRIASDVDRLWCTRESAFGGAAATSLVLLYGRGGLRVWAPHLDPDAAALVGAGAAAFDPVTQWDEEVQPIGVHARLGALLGMRQDAHYASSAALPCFEPQAELEPCLHAVLRAYLRCGDPAAGASEATRLSVAAQRARLPGFARGLERLLFGALEEATVVDDAGREGRGGYVEAVVRLVRASPHFAEVVATVGRLSERSCARLLFALAGSPLRIFRRCLQRGQLNTAAQHMLLVHDFVNDGGDLRELGAGDGEEAAVVGRPRFASDPSADARAVAREVAAALSDVPRGIAVAFQCAAELLDASLAAYRRGRTDDGSALVIAADVTRFVAFRMRSHAAGGGASRGGGALQRSNSHASSASSPVAHDGHASPVSPASAPPSPSSSYDRERSPASAAGSATPEARGWGLADLFSLSTLSALASTISPARGTKADADAAASGRPTKLRPPGTVRLRRASSDLSAEHDGHAAGGDAAAPPLPPSAAGRRAPSRRRMWGPSNTRQRDLVALARLLAGDSDAGGGPSVSVDAACTEAELIDDDPAWLGGFLERCLASHATRAMLACDATTVVALLRELPLQLRPTDPRLLRPDPAEASHDVAADADLSTVVIDVEVAGEEGETGFGLALLPAEGSDPHGSGTDDESEGVGAVVEAMKPGGAVQRTGRVQRGDRIARVGAREVLHEPHAVVVSVMLEAARALGAGGAVPLTVVRRVAMAAAPSTSLTRLAFEFAKLDGSARGDGEGLQDADWQLLVRRLWPAHADTWCLAAAAVARLPRVAADILARRGDLAPEWRAIGLAMPRYRCVRLPPPTRKDGTAPPGAHTRVRPPLSAGSSIGETVAAVAVVQRGDSRR